MRRGKRVRSSHAHQPCRLKKRHNFPLERYHLSVLDNLDTIDWSKISHAYGPATDLPATLRALASGDSKQRERALWELHGNIWHQGTVYEATAYAVPFLLELVRGNPMESAGILGLLAFDRQRDLLS